MFACAFINFLVVYTIICECGFVFPFWCNQFLFLLSLSVVSRAQAVLSVTNSLDALIMVLYTPHAIRHDLAYVSLPGVLGTLVVPRVSASCRF